MSSNIRPCTPTPQGAHPQPIRIKKRFGERLTRNAAIATLVLLTVVGVREALPQGDDIVQTMQQAVESEWDQNVGRLTYVNSTISDALQVFSGSARQTRLISPVTARAVQAWSAEAPYLLYENAGNVFAAADGEVSQIAHDDASEYIVRLTHADGLNTVYYGLSSCFVAEGDPVRSDTLLGVSGSSFAFEAARNGHALDVSDSLLSRESTR